MKYIRDNHDERCLLIFRNRSEYYSGAEEKEVFIEGIISEEAKKRNKKVKSNFERGFLTDVIESLLKESEQPKEQYISEKSIDCIDTLVSSLTSEIGRALLGLSVMQLCVKSITPDQSIRLHKGSANSASFSWVEGISMRTLDRKFVTPILRKYDLLRLNADGFMMTRTLAENYPYTPLYKANLKGARLQWLTLIEEVEKERTSALETLKYLISQLIDAASRFSVAAQSLVEISQDYTKKNIKNRNSALNILEMHADQSDYAARLLEIGMHSLMQSAVELGAFGDAELKPLAQMRSANHKHGNIGDIELLENEQIIEAWDAKYGKGYLREEIEEVVSKLQLHDGVNIIGFVTSGDIERAEETKQRIDEIKELYLVDLQIVTYSDWVKMIYERVLGPGMVKEAELSQKWFIMYCKYLALQRRDVAPIDEPSLGWINGLKKIIMAQA